MKVTLERCKKQLAILWFAGAGVIFLLVFFQTIFKYKGNGEDAWGWFLSTLMPTLSLIVGVLVSEATSRHKKHVSVDRFFYRLSFVLSLSYLVLALLTILMQPFLDPPTPENFLLLLKRSHFWLSPCQGLVAASLGVFFVRGKEG